jgi:DNA invertase Pin-like site-specific DNA recombinase
VKAKDEKLQDDRKRAIGYIRVSTSEQALGPIAQREAIARWAAANNVTVIAYHEDIGVSGASGLERKGLLGAIADMRQHHAHALIVLRRDRLARHVLQAATIEHEVARCGGKIICADGSANGDSPSDEFLKTILDGAAAYERQMIRARTRAALAVKRQRGEATGGNAPFGYRIVEGRLVVDEQEQQALKTLRSMRYGEGLSFRAIRREALKRGIYSRTQKEFTLHSLHNILSREVSHDA